MLNKILLVTGFALCSLSALAQDAVTVPAGTTPAPEFGKAVVNGRSVANSPITPALNCNDAGKIVLKVGVDRLGKVLSAEVTNGTTTESKCLIDYAKALAMATKFKPREDGPEKEVGTMTYTFSGIE